ncbi:hypothetical protein ACFL6C_12455 [Myxococcota bacterium]
MGGIQTQLANFYFLAKHDALLDKLGALAESYFQDDPNTSLIKLRQWGEILTQHVAAACGVYTTTDEHWLDLINRLKL